MILWSLQPRSVLDLIQRTGRYVCDPEKMSMPEFTKQYDWLAEEMSEQIGPPPPGVQYPVWAWYIQNGQRKKPDLRKERWCNGPGNEEYACIELDVPDAQVVLSDFDAWHIVLGDWLISNSEEEDNQQEIYYDLLSDDQKADYKRKNWKRVFDVAPFHNEWTTRGKWVQATFWELKSEYIQHVQLFRTACRAKL